MVFRITESIENFSEHKIYEGIFNIFERELDDISNFIAFSDGNMGVYSNKIHELHLRVCSEIENVLKIIIHKHFGSKQEVEEHWKDKKSEFLKDKNLIDEYEILKGKLSNKKECEKLDKLMYGFPDFLFYFKIACEKFNLDKKIVKFKAIISQSSNWNEIQPFKSDKAVPLWWTHYNNLKHDKIKKYNVCTFGDLISSMSGLFVLMNYLLKYQQNNYPTQNFNYVHFTQNDMLPYTNLEFCSFQSKLFEASVSYQLTELSMFLPVSIDNIQYEKNSLQYYHTINNSTCRAPFQNKSLKDINLKSSEYTEPNQSYLSSLFHTYVDYQKVVNFQRMEFWKLGHFGIFSN